MNGAFVHLFGPVHGDTIWPDMFFVHGIGGHHPANYLELLEHVASRGHAVVYGTGSSDDATESGIGNDAIRF